MEMSKLVKVVEETTDNERTIADFSWMDDEGYSNESENNFNEYKVNDKEIFLESISTHKIPDKLDLLQFAGARDVSEFERIYLFQKQEVVLTKQT